MHLTVICLAAPRRDARGAATLLRTAALALRRDTPGLAQVQCLRAERHITSDSVKDSRAAGALPEGSDIHSVLELHFESAEAAQACRGKLAWAAFREQVNAAAPILFSLDTLANVPIPPRGAAADGGFRRWMLLHRKADTAQQFRDAWFGRHADLVKKLPQVDGYLQNLVTARYDAQDREVGYDRIPVDGVAELCFANEAAMDASYASDARIALRDDGQQLLARMNTLLVQGEVLA